MYKLVVMVTPRCSWRRGAAARAFALVLAGAAGGALAQVQGEGRVIDRVVAIVEGQIITQSDLEFEAAVALAQQGAIEAAGQELDAETLRSALDYAIAQRLESLEAEELQAFVVEEREVEAAANALAERFGSPAAFERFLARHEADRAHLFVVLKRWLRATKLLDSRIHLRAQVSEADIKRYYDAHAAELGRPYDEVRPALREKLVRERYGRLAAAEIAQLRAAANVRLVAPPGGDGP